MESRHGQDDHERAVSLDSFIADDHDGVGPLFDCYGNGEISWSFPGASGS